MTIAIHNRTYVGISALTIRRLKDDVVYNFPVPMDFVLQTNVQERQQMGRNKLGRMVRLRAIPVAEMPILQIQYGHLNPEIISFKTGLELKALTGSVATSVPLILEVRQEKYNISDLFAGVAGADISVSDTHVSYLNTNVVSTKFTVNSVADTTTDAAAIPSSATVVNIRRGTNPAIFFHEDVIGQVVSIVLGLNKSGIVGLSSHLIGDVAINAALVNSENKIDIFEAPYASISLENSQIQFGGEQIDMTFYLNNAPGKCTSWNIYQTDLTVSC